MITSPAEIDPVVDCPVIGCNAVSTTIAADTTQDPLWQLLNIKTAFLQSAERECDEFRDALIDTSDRDLEDSTPCWCLDPPRRMKPCHDDYCEKARQLIAARLSA